MIQNVNISFLTFKTIQDVNIMAADGFVIQETRASAAMILNQFSGIYLA